MGDLLTFFILSFQALFFGACFVILIYLIIKRIQSKGNETFEQRDN